jgi:outer membrane protein TolC
MIQKVLMIQKILTKVLSKLVNRNNMGSSMPFAFCRPWFHLIIYGFVCGLIFCLPPLMGAQTRDSISFSEFLRTVLATNPIARQAAFENPIAENEILSALGGFDPLIKAEYNFKSESSKTKYDELLANVEVPLGTLFGPKILAGYERATGPFADPETFTGNAGIALLGLSVPLWQGVLTDRRRTTLDKARLRPALGTANQRFEQNNLLRAAALQYWTWSEAAEQLDVADSVFAISVRRAEFIAARARRGEIIPLDSIEALQEVERRRGDIFRARRTLEQASIDASVYLWTEAGIPQQLVEPPKSLPPLPGLDSTAVRADRDRALVFRPEMQRLDINQQNAFFDLALARESQKPLIETKAQWFYGIANGSTDNFKLGVNVAMPLFFRTATAQVELITISLERFRLQIAQTARTVNADIDNALSAARRASERAQAAEREYIYAVRMAEGEQRRFVEGETSLLFVNLRERAAAEAASRVIAARADYLRAWTQYYWATGTILQLTQ